MIQWHFQADFDRDDVYETDLLDWVAKPGGFVISRGMRPDGAYEVSKMTVNLHNYDGRFTPRNMDGPYYGALSPDVPVRLVATFEEVDYTVWTGYVHKMRQSWPARGLPTSTWECVDLAHYLIHSKPVNLTVADRRTDQAINAAATALGLSSDILQLDVGAELLPLHFALSQLGIDSMMDAVRSERGGMLWIDALGRIRFESRTSRLGVSSDYTWGSGTHMPPSSIVDLYDDYDMVDTVRVRTTVLRSGQADVPLFVFSRGMDSRPPDSMLLDAGAVWTRTFTGVSGFVAITEPIAGTDYSANSAIDGSGTNRTANLNVTVTDLGGGRFKLRLENTHTSGIYVTRFMLRGQPVEFYADRPESEVILPVAGRLMGQSAAIDLPFSAADTYGSLEYAYQLVRTYRWPVSRLAVTNVGLGSQSIRELLSVELGQRVQFSDKGLGTGGTMSEDLYYVDAISIHVPAEWGGQSLIMTATLTPSYVYRDLDKIVVEDFDRANATGLGQSTNGRMWANTTGWEIFSESARATSDTPAIPTQALGSANGVVETTVVV